MSKRQRPVGGVVNAGKVYYPDLVTTTFFKTWSMKCGYCERDFVRFAFFGKPTCPHCGIKNHPNFSYFI